MFKSCFTPFLLFIIVILLSPIASANDSPKNQSNLPSNKQNVLVLLFDDMRFDTFSYRNGPVNTPNIDALAHNGVRFDNAMTSTGLCSPSRAALFTGRWGHKTGLDDNVWLYHSRLTELSPDEPDVISSAVEDGFFVGYVGKWHLGAKGPALRGAQYTWGKEFELERNQRQWVPRSIVSKINEYKSGKKDANNEKHMYYQTLSGTYEDTTTYQKVQAGVEFLEQAASSDKPFFGVVSFEQPHPPYRVPEPYASMFDPNTIKKPENHLTKRINKPLSQDDIWWPWHDVSHMSEQDWRSSRAYYYGAIAMIDRAVGQIIDKAKALGVYDDLNIVILGDQGSMLGEHTLYDKGPYAYDELMRMPLIIKPIKSAPKTIERQVSMLDIAPTLSEMMGLKAKKKHDGFSLMSLIEKGEQGQYRLDTTDSSLYAYEWYNGGWFGIRAIRTPQMKFIWNPGDSVDELYDLIRDPNEINNLINDKAYSKRLSQMLELLRSELIRVEDPSVEKFSHHVNIYTKRFMKGN